MRLLIIEDEHSLAKALAKGLRRQGYAVDVAFDGQEGQELAEVNQYDLLILDLNLPGVDGLDVCRHLRREQPELLILILTARDRTLDKIAGLDHGADDYLVKPFHFEGCRRASGLCFGVICGSERRYTRSEISN